MSKRFPAIRKVVSIKNIWLLGLSLVPNILSAFMEGVSFGFILLAFQALGDSKETVKHHFFSFSFLDGLEPSQRFIYLIIFSILAQIFRSGLVYVGQIITLSVSTKIQIEAQKKVYQQILGFSFPFVSRYKIGDLLEYTKLPAHLTGALIEPLNRLASSGLAILASVVMMLFISIPLTIISVIVFGILFFSQKVVIRKIANYSEGLSFHNVEFSKHIVQSLNGLRLIHTFARQSQMVQKGIEALDKMARSIKELNAWTQVIGPINEIMGVSLVGVFLLIGRFFLEKEGILAIPMLLTFVMISYRLNSRLQMFLSGIATIAANWGSIGRLEEILEDEGKEFASSGSFQHVQLKNQISFTNIGLQYKGSSNPSLVDVNFIIPKGATVALVGSSGAGKSSILDLLLKLYSPTQGSIEVDGIDLNEFDTTIWRNTLGVVSQDTFIFNETVEENIRFGQPNISIQKIMKVAEMSGIHDLIMQLPFQYQTILGEKGYRLSGGEKQKIALARALIRDPEILILDEASSSLDTHSERMIQNAIAPLRGKKTLILVAHRLSTIMNADIIFVLEKGKIIEKGSHDFLLNKNGRYSFLWNIQSKDSSLQTSPYV